MARGKVGILAKSKTPQPHRPKGGVLKAAPKSAPPSKRKPSSTTENDKMPKVLELKGALFRNQEIKRKNGSSAKKTAIETMGKNGQMSKFKHFLSPPQDDTDDDDEDEDEDDESSVDINEDDLDSDDILKDLADDSSDDDDDDDDDDDKDNNGSDEDVSNDDDEDDDDDDDDISDEDVGNVVNVNIKKEIKRNSSTLEQVGSKVEKQKEQLLTMMKTSNMPQYTDEQTIFVKNLPADTTEKDLKKLSKDIIEIRLRIALSGRRSYAYLVFPSEAIAEKHYKLLQHKTLNGKSFIVDFVGKKSKVYKKMSSPKQSGEVQDLKRLFVTGLGKTFTDSDLNQLFPDANETVVIRRRNGNSLGYGFVSFDNEQVTQKNLIKYKSGKVFKEQMILATYAKMKEKDSNEKRRNLQEISGPDLDMKKLYLSGLGPKVSRADIEEAFPKSVNVDVISSKTDRPSYGFVTFLSEKDAKSSLAKTMGMKIGGHLIKVVYANKKKEMVALKRKADRRGDVSEPVLKKEKQPQISSNKTGGGGDNSDNNIDSSNSDE